MNSTEYTKIYYFLNKGEYPQNILQTQHNDLKCHKKSNFRAKINLYQIGKNDKLYKLSSDSHPILLKQVVQEGDVNDIIKLNRDSVAHPGINATIRKIQENYYWLGLNKDVREYVKTCHICQLTSALPPQPQKKLQPIIPPTKHWTHIGIDLICDLEANSEGYKHVLVTVCYLSKYCIVLNISDKPNETWIYGISKETIIANLNEFKDIFSDHLNRGVYMSQLHEELDKNSRKKGFYAPDTSLLKLLKNSTPEKMKREIMYTLMDFAEELFPDLGNMRSCDYVLKVIYGICMEYIQNKQLLPSNNTLQNDLHFPSIDPVITLITNEWKKEKCSQLNIPYSIQIEDNCNVGGHKLKMYKPWLCDDIVGDGNCLFRCLSKIISGSQDYHSKIRGELCRYIMSEGLETMGWYLKKVHSTTPLEYLKSNDMLADSTWGSDIELIAASALLETDIYVANKYSSSNIHNLSEVRWNLIRCSDKNSKTNAIYIANYNSHFEPVRRMLNSFYPTFLGNENEINAIQLE